MDLLKASMDFGIETSNSSLKKLAHEVIIDVTSSLSVVSGVLLSSILVIKLSFQIEEKMFTRKYKKF